MTPVATATLVYLYGPPAAGKLTIATRLAEVTGARLFHNHLTVNAIVPVFEFNSPPFTEVLHRVRLDVFGVAVRAGIDLIFTNSSVWTGQDGRARFEEFANKAKRAIEENGGSTLFVQILAAPDVLAERVANESRQTHRKLVDAQRLCEVLEMHDATPLHPDDLTINSGTLTPDESARLIVTELERRVHNPTEVGITKRSATRSHT